MTNLSKAEICDIFNAKVRSLFDPSFYVNAYVANILGPFIGITFAECVRDRAPSNIMENCKAFMKFMVNVNLDGSAHVECIVASYHLRKAGITFRKINAKSEAEAMAKCAAWFAKNQAQIIALVA